MEQPIGLKRRRGRPETNKPALKKQPSETVSEADQIISEEEETEAATTTTKKKKRLNKTCNKKKTKNLKNDYYFFALFHSPYNNYGFNWQQNTQLWSI